MPLFSDLEIEKNSSELDDFAIIATHTDPDEATKEVGALHKVYHATKAHWDLEVRDITMIYYKRS